MIGATLAAYHSSRETRAARQQVIVDYLNTMPLGAAAGFGEVHGIGAALRVWFDMDPARVLTQLDEPDPTRAKARAYRHVLALLYAVRAPSHYLVRNRRLLQSRIDAYLERLRTAGVIDARLCALAKTVPLEFAPLPRASDRISFIDRKAVDALRFELGNRLAVPDLYTLDGLDLTVDSTIDGRLQERITQTLRQLTSPQFLAAHGLIGPHLLARGDPGGVIFSFLLIEARPEGNLVRVNTDTLDGPFDINQGMKLELGSTAKLRTLAHYLEIMAQLHEELSKLDPVVLRQRATQAREPLTRWAATRLEESPGLDLESFLRGALERLYSASPDETFFTGGGTHRFHNFEPQDDGRILSVREAFVHSTNLVFIRLMRDLVRFHEAHLAYDAAAVLARADSLVRRQLLTEIVDEETQEALAHAYERYRNLDGAHILARLLGPRAYSARNLARVYYAWHRREGSLGNKVAEPDTLAAWLSSLSGGGGSPPEAEIRRLERAYGNPHLTLADFSFLLKSNPLELWCAGELLREPHTSWDEVLGRSAVVRREASAWLFNARNRRAQDLRLRIRVERDAFTRMTRYWRALAFPFDTLVPSYATAIGSSADRPAALAELMGIIVSDGRRRATSDIRRLTFAAGTPYHTVLEPTDAAGSDRVMSPVVAQLLREVLAGVVERGTARRLDHAFVGENGVALPVGGKTGSGDNRFQTFARGGRLVASRARSRTGVFVFSLGRRWFGVISASVPGPQAEAYAFTSSLPVAVLKLLAPTLSPAIGESEDAARQPKKARSQTERGNAAAASRPASDDDHGQSRQQVRLISIDGMHPYQLRARGVSSIEAAQTRLCSTDKLCRAVWCVCQCSHSILSSDTIRELYDATGHGQASNQAGGAADAAAINL
jgi:membrane peptidoglycan carboxypeptidase